MNETAKKHHNRFAKKSGAYICDECGKKTRDTGEGGAGVGLCKKCYDAAEEQNRKSDSGKDDE